MFLRSWDGKVEKTSHWEVKTRGLPPPLTGQLFSLTLRVPGSRGQNPVSRTGCHAGGGGWEAAGGSRVGSRGRRRGQQACLWLLHAPPPQHEGWWPLGNWAAVGRGQGKPKLNTGWALMGSQGAAGGFSGGGGTRPCRSDSGHGQEGASAHGNRVQGGSCPTPQATGEDLLAVSPHGSSPGGPCPQTDTRAPREGLNLAKTLAFSES